MEASKSVVKTSLKRFCQLLAFWFFAETIFTIAIGISNFPNDYKPDVIVVFGNKVKEDGTLSNRLKARMNECLKMHKKFPKAIIFTSGGLGKEGHLEGTKMVRYLIENGVAMNQIVIDNDGNNSLATIENFKKTFGNKKPLFVSQFYHPRRIEVISNKLGLKQYESVAPNYFELRDCYSLFREFFAICKFKLVL